MTTTDSAPSASTTKQRGFWQHAADIRSVTGVLFACYGAILTIRGALATDAAIAQAEGVNINLWTGLAMLVFATVCLYFAFAREQHTPLSSE
ncbi:hypothetical protein [Mycolicibacterium goodii]|uniref:Uncharacterized protein n=1 Tax=Mycolicibacterium goodii TaxID=134601 RepID=A0A0K0XD44_MYCGD|nr:hypothetical protein AFA91_29015 [Mycolicibacterium goodii]